MFNQRWCSLYRVVVMKTFETFLPLFKGTYGNYWDDYCPTDEDGVDIPFDRYDINLPNFLESIGKSMIDWFKSDTELFTLAGIESIEFQNSHSPAYYNFSNDSINVSITINDHSALAKYVFFNYDYFKKRIWDEHTSRSGFISYQSNSINDWYSETNGFTDFDDNQYYLGFLLDIICEIEGYEERDAYWDWCEMANEEDFVTIHPVTWDMVDLTEALEKVEDEIDWDFGYLKFIKEEAVNKSKLFNTDWRDEIDKEKRIELLEGLYYEPEDFL